MNINQIGQKKKKQAVRRLSQSSPASQGNRKEDMRRKLETKRLENAQAQNSGRQRISSRAPYSRRGKSSDGNFASSALGRTSHRNPKSSQVGTRKYTSPLINPSASEGLATAGEKSHTASTSKPVPSISNSPMKGSNRQENVFGSALFKPSTKNENIFKGSPFENSEKETGSEKQGDPFASSKSPLHSGNVFGVFTSTNPAEKTESISKMQAALDTNMSKSSFATQMTHQSPLTTLTGTTSKPMNIFGSSMTGKTEFVKQENIFTSTKSETSPANVFGGVAERGKNFPNASQTSSSSTVVSSIQSLTQTKPHPSPLSGLVSGQINTGNIFGQTVGGIGENKLLAQSDSNILSAAASASNIFATMTGHGDVFGSVAIPSRLYGHDGLLGYVASSQTGMASLGANKAGDGQNVPKSSVATRVHAFEKANESQSVFSTNNVSSTSVSKITTSGGPGSVFGSASLPSNSSAFQNSLFQTPVLPKASLKDSISLAASVTSPFTTSAFQLAQTPSATQTPSMSGFLESNRGRKGVGGSQEIEPGEILSSEKVVNPKMLKRSISSVMDVSGLTSIVIKGLPEEYFKKELLIDYLSVYGKIKKVALQPARENAVITFHSHESAKKAKSKALELFPLKDIGVYWCKRKRSSSESSTVMSKTDKALSEVNIEELHSRKISISKALRSIDVSVLPPALTAQERFSILDEIDKKIRQAIKPYTDLATAPTIVGVCPDMCPEKERYMRESRVNLSVFEMVPGTQDYRDGDVPRVDHTRAVKEYSRSAADQSEPLANEMRPVAVLQMTLDYLAANVMDNGEGRWSEWFNFLWNRTRAIRKDISQQHLCNVECVELVEKITRFHLFCAHYLCEEDIHSFDPKINNENLTKCLQTLKQFYLDLYSNQNIVCSKEAEFQAYDILLNLNEGDTLRKAMQYRIEVRNSSEVKFALEVFSSLNSNNYVRFFKLLQTASYLHACIMHRYFTQVRSRALHTMTRAYRPQEPYPQQALLDVLAFEDKEEVILFCAHYNLTTSNEFVQFSKSSFMEPETVCPLQRAKTVIESKRICSIGEVVSGAPLQPQPYHEPLCSFDSHGRFTGLPSLVELLGGTAVSVEPESPDILYDPVVSVPSEQRTPEQRPPEQRTPEVTQDVRAREDAQLVMKEIQNFCASLLGIAVDELVRDISQDTFNEVKLKLEVSKVFAKEFIAESLLVMVHEIANQCVDEENKIKREKIAIAESKNRVSAMILREIIKVGLKSELITIAKNVKSEMERKLRAQSFVKMSAVIMKEMTEEIVVEECHDIAVTSRKEVIDQKKASLWEIAKTVFQKQQKKFFKRWSKEYHTRVHIKDILLQMPAIPPLLTTTQQVEKLFCHESDAGVSIELSQSPLFYSSFSTERTDLQQHLEEMAKEHESKTIRAREPIDIPAILSEMADTVSPFARKSSNLLKLAISLPQFGEGDSPVTVEGLIKRKFSGGAVAKSSTVPAVLGSKVEILSCYTSKTHSARNTREFKIDIKTCSGLLSNEESLLVQDGHLFLGLTSVLFVLKSSDQHRDEMFWTSSRTRLRQILKSKPPVPSIPLVILNFGSGDETVIKRELNLGRIVAEGLVSHWVVYERDERIDTDELHKQLVEIIQWLTSRCPSLPSIKRANLKSFVENEVLKHFTVPLYEEIDLRRIALLQPQCPEVIIELYNAVISHMSNAVTDTKLKAISWPTPEFITKKTEGVPTVLWNSSETFQRLRNILGKLKLPPAPPPAQDGKWKTECTLCLDYIRVLLSEEPLKNFSFSLVNSVERILNQITDLNHSPATLTAADVPWPQVVETCIDTMLAWFHSTPPSLAKENVYYMGGALEKFTEPDLWMAAVTETLKLAKETAVKRQEEKKSNSFHNLTAAIEEELERIESTSPHVNSPRLQGSTDDIEQKVRFLDEKLGMEKLNCERFEDQLRTLLDEGTHVECFEAQGVKRKLNPAWASNSKVGKTFVRKVDCEIEGIHLPDLDCTLDSFETSLITFQDQLKLHRHVEEFTEQQLRETLSDNINEKC